jgi:serine/threonine protein kinase
VWQRELGKLKRIQALNQRHIVKLIATFRQGEQDFYFISESSDGGNLRDFWKTFPRVLTASLVKSVTEQLYGLVYASFEVGLTTTLIEGFTLSNDDLNPEHILWFKEGSGVEHKIGTMKTCHQSAATAFVPGLSLSNELYMASEQGSNTWQDLLFPTDDMWAMGCITLQFIIWLLYGCAGLNKFHQDIESGFPERDSSRHFRQSSSNGGRVHPVVLEWMSHMARDPVCRVGQTALGDLLKLTRDRLLVVSVDIRRFIGPTVIEDDISPAREEFGNEQPIDNENRLQKLTYDCVVKMTPELWNKHRGHITRLYVQENKRIEEIKEIMKTGNNLFASTQEYKQQLDKWLFLEGTPDRRGLKQAEVVWESEFTKKHRARPKEVCDWMHRILSGAKSESYWLPCPPLPPPDLSLRNC